MKPKYPDVYVELSGHDGNACGIIARVVKALRRAQVEDYVVAEFMEEVTKGDYDKVLATCQEWVDVG